ncbi:MAG: BfmA/BtgA family mobilization protein [Candidatus Bipolaricaulis sp.]|nr:BfmA/BtgA family mobilization protein [Candidatus Bipolaricaulis sp.]
MTDRNLTTVNIGSDAQKHLKKMASHHGLSQINFLNASVSYFRKTGINPAEEIYSPREEIAKLTKRVDEVIRFLQTHEKQKLSPLMERLILLEKQLKENYSKIITVDDLNRVQKEIATLVQNLQLNNQNQGQLIREGFKNVHENSETIYTHQKRIIALLALMFEAFKNRNMTGGFRETDIKNFEHALSQI